MDVLGCIKKHVLLVERLTCALNEVYHLTKLMCERENIKLHLTLKLNFSDNASIRFNTDAVEICTIPRETTERNVSRENAVAILWEAVDKMYNSLKGRIQYYENRGWRLVSLVYLDIHVCYHF